MGGEIPISSPGVLVLLHPQLQLLAPDWHNSGLNFILLPPDEAVWKGGMGKLCTAPCTQLHSCSTGKQIFPWQECAVGSWCPQAPPALLFPHPTSAPTQPQAGTPWNVGTFPWNAGTGGHREGTNAPRTLCTSSALTLCAQTTCKGTSGAHPTLGLLPLGCGVGFYHVHGFIDPWAGPVLGTGA